MLDLQPEIREAIATHAEETYPEECCGLVVVRSGKQEAVRITNIQNELHARDPETFPRTAATAYAMRYQEVEPYLEAAYRGELELLAFYHSHPEHDAYFSAEDRAAAEAWLADPNYARAAQIVVSVHNGRVVAARAFRWDATRSDFVDEELNWPPAV
jgi:proteasome lid subunit RPN8/RPN11